MKHVSYVPDCPDCGMECTQMMQYEGEDMHPVRWWHCHYCGWNSERAGSWDGFYKMTHSLTRPLRGDDHD